MSTRAAHHHHLVAALWLLAACLSATRAAQGQEPLEPVQGWLATVEPDGSLLLTWRAATDSAVAGYCVSSLSAEGRWLPVDTLRPRTDTAYRPASFQPSVASLYCVHAFDTSLTRTSAMTPPFGNMVLKAWMNPCDSMVALNWSAYSNMPGGLGGYKVVGSFRAGAPPTTLANPPAPAISVTLPVPASADSILLWVEAKSADGQLHSTSNRLSFIRPGATHPAYLRADTAWFDATEGVGTVRFWADTTYPTTCTLLRAARGQTLQPVANPPVGPDGEVLYTDNNLQRSGSPYLYQLTATNGCGRTVVWSDTLRLVMPSPVEPAAYLPNVIVPGAEGPNARFCPRLVGLLPVGYDMWVYDRTGRLQFHTTNPDECFDGTSSNGRQLPQGTYAYVLRGTFADRTTHTFAGTITIIR